MLFHSCITNKPKTDNNLQAKSLIEGGRDNTITKRRVLITKNYLATPTE